MIGIAVNTNRQRNKKTAADKFKTRLVKRFASIAETETIQFVGIRKDQGLNGRIAPMETAGFAMETDTIP